MSASLKGIIFNFYPYVSSFSVYAESAVLGPLHLFPHGPFKSPFYCFIKERLLTYPEYYNHIFLWDIKASEQHQRDNFRI